MKRIFSTELNSTQVNVAILLLRVFAAAFMLTHGIPKFSKLLAGGEIQFGDPIGLGPAVSLGLAVFAEFACSVLIIFGLGTRLAVVPQMVTMFVAAFVAHGADPFGKKELALIYLLIFTVLLLTGSGKYSLDHILLQQKK